DLLEVRGAHLLRLAWHIGNRHTPCEIQSDALLIRDDHVIAAMLTTLGAKISKIDAPFQPEGGAYGHGRTFGHSHD
ncbi:MAG: urease accessory protein UreE, partial [Mangrovicoccus sp.]